jgi:hypothetical protein
MKRIIFTWFLFWIYIYISLAYQIGCSCKNGGRCVMNYGSYGCECPYGYTGINCETCIKEFFFLEFSFKYLLFSNWFGSWRTSSIIIERSCSW